MTNAAYQSCKRSFQSYFVQLTFFKNTETNYFELQTDILFFNLQVIFNLDISHGVSKSRLMLLFYRKKDMLWQIKIGCNYYFYGKTIFTYLHIWQNQTACIMLTTRTVVVKYLGVSHFGLYSPQKLTELRCFIACLITGLAAIGLMYSAWIFHWLG